jgi:hypothetical protein
MSHPPLDMDVHDVGRVQIGVSRNRAGSQTSRDCQEKW